MGERRPIHVIVATHTTRHLRRTLMGVACQTRRADSITVSCDVADDDIREVLASAADEFGLPITLVRRPHQGQSRSSQVRNNGVRALLDRGADAEALLVFFDGDVCPGPDVLEKYDELRNRGDLVIGYRIDLTPQQTEAFDETALRRRRPPTVATDQQLAKLRKRHRRYLRMAFLRRFGLAKKHKPKVLSANHGVTLSVYRQVNGYDEEYQSWGAEDDDFGRRVYMAGGKPVVAVRELLAYHQYHQRRSQPRWKDNPGSKRLMAGGPAYCRYGLDNPYPQDALDVLEIRPR